MILVDQAVWPWRGRLWAHLVSDADYGELHRFAAGIGVRRLAFQGDHYDVDAHTRSVAIGAGAAAVDSRELVRRLRGAGLRRRMDRSELRWQRGGTWSPSALAGAPSLLDALSAHVDREVAVAMASQLREWAGDRDEPLLVGVLTRVGEIALVLEGPHAGAPPLADVVVSTS